MEEKRFIEAVKTKCLYAIKDPNDKKHRYSDKKYNFVKPKVVDLDKHYLYREWCSGGVTGGSCWDDGKEDHHRPIIGETEPEFDDFDSLLLELCPNIGFLQYKKISKIIEQDSSSENEYYGNCREYTYKVVNLRKLFDALNEMGL